MSEDNKFTRAELLSKSYRWRRPEEKPRRTKFFIFTVSRSGNQQKRSREYCRKPDDTVKLDPDLCNLLDGFIESHTRDCDKDINYMNNMTEKEMMKEVEKMKNDQTLYDYDCFFFIMLTFVAGAGSKDTGLLFKDNSTVNLEEVYKRLDDVKSMLNKPKVFLVQADSISLIDKLNEKFYKGTEKEPKMKIPHEADRITIMSTVPCLKPWDSDNEDSSPLIKAFLDVMGEDDKKPQKEKADFFTLTGRINKQVEKMLDDFKTDFKTEHPDFKHKDLTVPLVTSTLRKELIF